jgi:hypothetical protein
MPTTKRSVTRPGRNQAIAKLELDLHARLKKRTGRRRHANYDKGVGDDCQLSGVGPDSSRACGRIAVWTQDYDAYQKCFVHASYTSRWNASPVSGIHVRTGWDEIASRVQQMFALYQGHASIANAYETEVLDLKLRIDGDTAWATFRQKYPATIAPAGTAPTMAWHHAGPSPSYEMRVFERHAERWLIAFLGYLASFGCRDGAEPTSLVRCRTANLRPCLASGRMCEAIDQTGRMMRARNPPSGRLLSVSWPSWACTTASAIANPRPIPPVSRPRDPSTR